MSKASLNLDGELKYTSSPSITSPRLLPQFELRSGQQSRMQIGGSFSPWQEGRLLGSQTKRGLIDDSGGGRTHNPLVPSLKVKLWSPTAKGRISFQEFRRKSLKMST